MYDRDVGRTMTEREVAGFAARAGWPAPLTPRAPRCAPPSLHLTLERVPRGRAFASPALSTPYTKAARAIKRAPNPFAHYCKKAELPV